MLLDGLSSYLLPELTQKYRPALKLDGEKPFLTLRFCVQICASLCILCLGGYYEYNVQHI